MRTIALPKYLIGAGGWAYFQVPSMHPLVAYSRAFDFVEVNTTFRHPYIQDLSKNLVGRD